MYIHSHSHIANEHSYWFRNPFCAPGNSSRELHYEIAGPGLGAGVDATEVHHPVAAPLPVRLR